MKKSIKLIIGLLTVMFVLLFIHLQQTQEYLFFFREKLMVFYYDTSIIAERYFNIGGFGILLTHWLLQFFILKYVGAVVTAFIGVLSAYFLWASIPSHRRAIILLPLCIFPFIFQCHALFDIYYSYQGLVAYFLFTLFACLVRIISDKMSNPNLKVLVGTLFTLLLFFLGGAVGFLLAVYIFIVELIDKPKDCWRYLLPIVLILIICAICIQRGLIPLWKDAITNSSYYEPILTAANFFHSSWILVGILPLLAPLFSSLESKMKKIPVAICTVVFLVAVSAFTVYSADRNKQKMYPMIAMDCFIYNQDWQGLLNLPYCQLSNYLLMNRVNLALSHTGRFLNDFFKYPQIAPSSILTELNKLSLDVEIITTQAEIFWQVDNMAYADERAFNSYEGLRYGSPNNLQMLVKTSLVFGRYQHAEKYIKMLEKTKFYKDWATSQRRFLYNDKAVEADPIYGSKRRSLPVGTREFIQAHGPYYDLLVTIRTNPKAIAARDYAIGYLLLANDIPHINAFIEEFYNTEVMPKMPLRLQEAAIAANETNLDWCREHGVEESVIEDYRQLKQAMLKLRQNGTTSTASLAKWRYTYWYYLLITSPNIAKMREELIRRQDQQNAASREVSAH